MYYTYQSVNNKITNLQQKSSLRELEWKVGGDEQGAGGENLWDTRASKPENGKIRQSPLSDAAQISGWKVEAQPGSS